MIYGVLADITVLIHCLFVLFVIFGGGFLLRWKRLIWAHLPAAVWGVVIELAGWTCPLTYLENYFRRLAGETGYRGSFIENYLEPILYPGGMSQGIHVIFGIIVLLINFALYSIIWRSKNYKRPISHRDTDIRRQGKLAFWGAVCAAGIACGGMVMLNVPGESFKGGLPPVTPHTNHLASRLSHHVNFLAGTIGERNVGHYEGLQKSSAYIIHDFRQSGYEPREGKYVADGRLVKNIEVWLTGTVKPDEIVVIGAHYDTAAGSPGADDNASGVAAVLELARYFRAIPTARTLRFVTFVNEEPPYFFWSKLMGSRVYASDARKRHEQIVAMISIESVGYFSEAAESQHYPPPFGIFYPDEGDFIAFVANLGSRSLLHRSIATFRESTFFPSEGLSAPAFFPGIGWSDQSSFWREGYPAIMITDTALYRNPHYHLPSDTPEKLNYIKMALVVAGIRSVVADLVQ